jgi:hypothetical protein
MIKLVPKTTGPRFSFYFYDLQRPEDFCATATEDE